MEAPGKTYILYYGDYSDRRILKALLKVMVEIIEKFDRVWHPMKLEMPTRTVNVELKKKDSSIIDGEIYVDISGHFIYHDGGWHNMDEYTHWRFKDTVSNRRNFRKEE